MACKGNSRRIVNSIPTEAFSLARPASSFEMDVILLAWEAISLRSPAISLKERRNVADDGSRFADKRSRLADK